MFFCSTISDPGDKCSFSNCVPAFGVILEPALPQDVSVSQLAVMYPPYKQALRTFNSVNPANSANVTVIMFDNMEHCEYLYEKNIYVYVCMYLFIKPFIIRCSDYAENDKHSLVLRFFCTGSRVKHVRIFKINEAQSVMKQFSG